jgi:GT2 family glycosyltransferase
MEPTRPVTAIVVNFNGGDRTLDCIASLLQQTVPCAGVAVVDNASSDGSVDKITKEYPEVTVLRQPENLGLSKARNIGIRHAQSPLVLSIDSDMYLRPDALEKMLAAQVQTGAAVICPRVIFYPERSEIQCEGAEVHFTASFLLRNTGSRNLADVPDPLLVGGAPGGCLLLNRAITLDVGAFNELFFFYHEDVEFSLRMRCLGHDIVCVAAAAVDHDRGEGTPGLSFRGVGKYPARRAHLSMRNRLIIILIHYRLRTILILLPPLLLYEIGTLGLAAVRGWLREYLRAWSEIVGDREEILRHRRIVQARRVRGDRQLFTADELTFGAGVMRGWAERMITRTIVWVTGGYWRLVRRFLGR